MNTRQSPMIITGAIVFVTLACAPGTGEFSVPDRTAITQASNQYLTALAEGDFETYAQLFATNAQQLIEGGAMLDGRSAIRSYAEDMAANVVESETSNILVGGSGGLAYRWMDYSLTTSGTVADTAAAQSDTTDLMSSTTMEGRVLSVYRRQDDGTWLIVADTWSAADDQPSAMTAESASS